MKPANFASFVNSIAKRISFPLDKLILGGDHLGPNPWKKEDAGSAMTKACAMVDSYVRAGFQKIHLDASMQLGGDHKDGRSALNPELAAERAAILCLAAEKAHQKFDNPPVYVIGTEVPVPGGAVGEDSAPQVTEASALRETIELTRGAFRKRNLDSAWERVIAVVTQPGVEFGHDRVFEYDRTRALELTGSLKKFPGLVFEGHSTDYQLPEHLKQMAEDGIAILKVGPALTFAFREAVFLLSHLEDEIARSGLIGQPAGLPQALEDAMRAKPGYWKDYYPEKDQRLSDYLRFSLSDRCRYYWPDPAVEMAKKVLLANVAAGWPSMPELRQFFPAQYWKVRRGLLESDPVSFMHDHIQDTLRAYPDLA
jgi:D-tagatose-1,6-bisphosphate aldolase subunit GatZ/KbaZ